MATTPDRKRLLPKAIEYFSRQTYSPKELLVLDEGQEDWGVPIVNVRRVRVPSGASLGEKLNLAIPQAKGEIIIKCDDDDWYHARWMESLVDALLKAEPGVHISTVTRFLTLLLPEWKTMTSQDGWMLGNSLCFRRESWKKARFDESRDHLADSHFLAFHGNRVASVNDPSLCIVLRHGIGHLWTRLNENSVEDHFQRNFVPTGDPPEAFMPEDDAGFYRLLRHDRLADKADPGVPCDPDGYGMAMDSASYLRRLCEEEKPKIVVELGTGPGVSLSILARWCPPETSIWTVDHVQEWQEEGAQRLKRLGIERPEINYVHAEMEDVQVGSERREGYDPIKLAAIPSGIDLLLVDGHTRIGALSAFLGRLSPSAIVLLDDLRRPEERALYARWKASLEQAGRRFTSAVIPTSRVFGELRLLP